ncbi:hypothetical protein YC2023_058821 [Brassica napus]
MKSLGECSQLNYGAPRRRIRLNGVQMWELCNLQIRRPSVLANLGRMDRSAHILILTANELLGSDEPGLPEVPFAFPDHIQHPAKVILPDLGRIKWMFGLHKKSNQASKLQQNKQRNQRKRQNMFDDDEKRVRNGDRPFTKAKRSNCDVLDRNELQTYASLEKMLHKAIHVVQQLKKKGNTNTSSAPKQQNNSSSFSNCDLKTNVLSSDKSKAVKPTSKAHSTRCFKCHRIGHYANKCQNQKPLVTLENENVETEPGNEEFSDPLPIFDDYTHEPMADLRTNLFEEGTNDAPLSSAPGKTNMHGLIMESSNDICSLFDSYLPTNESSSHEITWRMFSTQLRSSSKKNQIKRSSDVGVMQFANQETFSSREFGSYGSSSPHLDPYRE